jgi:YggT family protein
METSFNSFLVISNYTFFNFCMFILVIRLLLAWVQADYYHPATQLIVRSTNFIIKPLRNLIPNYRTFETASFIAIIIISLIKNFIFFYLVYNLPNIFGLIMAALSDCLNVLLDTFFYAILLQAVLSWLQPNTPANAVLYKITAPIMRPLQRFIPPMGGFDISPMPAMLILLLLKHLNYNFVYLLGVAIAIH